MSSAIVCGDDLRDCNKIKFTSVLQFAVVRCAVYKVSHAFVKTFIVQQNTVQYNEYSDIPLGLSIDI